MTMIGLRYDLRAPSFCSVTHAELYAACLEQCAWADRLGLDFVVLSEHHGVDDGYLPAPLTLAAAIAGRTKSIRISARRCTWRRRAPTSSGEAASTAW